MRGAGWRPRGGGREPTEKEERDPRAPQRVYYEDVEGTARAEAVVHAMRKVRFGDNPGKAKEKAKEPPEIPTVVLDDSSDEEGTQAAPVRVDSDED
jgi:hypothetical protein